MFLIDILFPKICLGCGYLGCYICPHCQKKLIYLEQDFCLYCKRKSLYGLTHPGCTRPKGIDGMMAIFQYNDFLKKIIKEIKYRLVTEVWREFSLNIYPEQLLKLGLYKRQSHKLYLQPVPLHKARLRIRGFNQAKLITDFFQKYIPYPQSEILIRKKETPSQAMSKNGSDRYQNVRGAFSVDRTTDNKKLILVDDVVTSGATVKEAAKTLKKAGVKTVFVLALARG